MKLALFGWAVIVTAVLLLLSLPVLAGKLIILPAINLAVCWEPLYIVVTQSAGNLLNLNLLENLRGHTPKYFGFEKLYLSFTFCSRIMFIRYLLISYYFKQFKFNKNKLNILAHARHIQTTTNEDIFRNKDLFAYYFTGLIEGDGSIITPKTLKSISGKTNYPSIQITFVLKDLPLALIIQKTLGVGSLSRKKGVNAYVLTINSYKGIISVISLINGKMRTPKIHSLNALIDFYNNTKGVYIEKYPVCIKPLNTNPWLAGFIEADGSFQVRTTVSGKYPKYECKLELSQRQIDHKGYDNLEFLTPIADFFNTEVKKIRVDKPNPEYRVRTVNIKGNLNLKNYFLTFPLFGVKYLDSLDWIKVVDMFDKKEHLTKEGKEMIVQIKSNMNNFRTEFTWNHLQNFYDVKI